MELPVVFNDRYQLIKKIGEGGLAEVYQAQDMALGRMVAVKVLRTQYTRDPNFLVNFHREAQSAAKLSDATIVTVYDFGQAEGRPYIVLEWIAGSDLRTIIDDQGSVPLEQALEYAMQVCTAVGTAHRAGLVHGDLKPGNILITPTNQAKVTDFGLARALGASAMDQMDEDEVVWGTPAYFAPEQASGGMVLPTTDVYAIGIILYEMLTGRVPFIGVDDQEVARKQLYEAHIPADQINPHIPAPVARIIDAAMAKNRNERFLTADHLREALQTYKQGDFNASHNQTPISAVVGTPLQNAGYIAPPPPPPPPPPAHYVPAAQASKRADKKKGGMSMLLIFGGGLFILVAVGLIFGAVIYTAYVAESALNAATPTLSSSQIQMPDIVGADETTARIALENMGLQLVVAGEAPHTTLPPGAIIEQSVPPGQGVDLGTTISVILSQGPTMVELPHTAGMPFAEAEALLISRGVKVQKYEDWSAETPGHVVRQDPPGGALVPPESIVTLIVSSGSRIPVEANMGGQILLAAYEIPRLHYKAGEAISLTFFWQPIIPPTEDYNLFIHLTTMQGGIVSEIDVPPQGGTKPTNSWQKGEIIIDPYQLPLPATVTPGEYQIRVGFYNPNTNARLPITNPGRAEQDNLGALILRTIQVVP
jgi:serine/threonine-protein kinase